MKTTKKGSFDSAYISMISFYMNGFSFDYIVKGFGALLLKKKREYLFFQRN